MVFYQHSSPGNKVNRRKGQNELRYWVDTYYDIQALRLATGNRISAIKKRKQEPDSRTLTLFESLYTIEKQTEKWIKQEIKGLPIWENYLKQVRGIGPCFAGGLISWIDITKCPTVSSLWYYSGLAPQCRKVKGEKMNWNSQVKDLCWKIGNSFIKQKSPYAKLYYEYHDRDLRKHPELEEYDKSKKKGGKRHLQNRARRYMVKIFLQHLWLKWRELEGLPISKPYSIERLGHAEYISVEEFMPVSITKG